MATQFLIKNHINFINQFKTYIQSNRIHYPSVLEGDDNDELDEVIDQLESANNSESDFNGVYFGVTYDVNREAKDDTGHFYLDYLGGTEIYHDERVYDPTVKKFPQNIDTENYPTPRQSPRKGGKRRKRKTRKKRGRGNVKRTKRKTRKKRGAYLSDLEDSDDEMNNEQGWGADTEFLVKNDEVNINAFLSEIRRRQNEGSYVIHSPSDELGLEFLHSMMMESLLTGEYVEGIYGVTYAPNRNEGQYGRFFANYFDDTDSLTERLQIVSENNRFPNDVTQLQSAVEEQIILPHPGGESPDTIMEVDDLSGGRKRRRKRKTRKKKNRKRRTKKKSRKHKRRK